MWREFSPAAFLIFKAGEKTMTENILLQQKSLQ